MKNYTDVSRKITENDNFIVSINHPMKKNQTAAMLFDDCANSRLGGLPSATAMAIIGLDWPVICVYTATASRGYQSWQMTFMRESVEQQMIVRDFRKGGVTLLPQGDYVHVFLDMKDIYVSANYRLYVYTKDNVICEQHGEYAAGDKPRCVVEASARRIAFADEMKNLIRKYLTE